MTAGVGIETWNQFPLPASPSQNEPGPRRIPMTSVYGTSSTLSRPVLGNSGGENAVP